jgi:hypothetical protein
MKILLLAALLCFPVEQEPTLYPVSISATYQGHRHAASGFGMAVDIQIRNSEGVELAHLETIRPSPYYLEVSEPPPYRVRAKGLWHLASGGTFDTGVIDLGEQRAGDVGDYVPDPERCETCWKIQTGDNTVEIEDWRKFRRWFGEPWPPEAPGYFEAALADLDGDGVGITDFNLLTAPGTWGHSGYEFSR